MSRAAVLLMAYGTPERMRDVEPFYTHIRRGSPPPPALLEELLERYRAVGGPTPLNRITQAQADALEDELSRRGVSAAVYVGFKHVPPFIGEVVETMAQHDVGRAVCLVLAPHYSLRSVAEYAQCVEKAQPPELLVDIVLSWHDHPSLIEVLSSSLARLLVGFEDPLVLFTSHSIPQDAVERGDPYPEQVLETARQVASRSGARRWAVAYQSAGRTQEAWLGPDLSEAIAEAAAGGERAIVVHAIGFVSDHLEILYDLDIEARQAAESRGLRFARVPMPNADPDFAAALADVLVPRLGGAS